jgi:hypothetical protein
MSEELTFELPPEVEACDMVVVYESATGTIRHTHKVFTWRGGDHPKREALEKEALAEARQLHDDLDDVEMLVVDPRRVQLDAMQRVDVRKRTLVASPVPRRSELR